MYDSQSISGGGAIWSTIAYSFESPLKNLLDSPSGFTLEELLNQDELLQELRSMHPQLIQFFSQEHVVAQLVLFLVRDYTNPMSIHTMNNNNDDGGTEEEEGLSSKDLSNSSSKASSQKEEEEEEDKQEETPRVLRRGSKVENDTASVVGTSAITIPTTGEFTISSTPSINGTHPSKHWLYRHAIMEDSSSASPTIECVDIISDPCQDVPEDEEKEDDDVKQQQQEQEQQRSLKNVDFMESTTTTIPHNHLHDHTYIRYPYMACEIICCEIPTILDLLVTGNLYTSTSSTIHTSLLPSPTSILDLLFSMLDSSYPLKDVSLHNNHNNKVVVVEEEEKEENTNQTSTTTTTTTTTKTTTTMNHSVYLLDDRRAGYLEKILSILFRERPNFMTSYLNGDHHHHHPTTTTTTTKTRTTKGLTTHNNSTRWDSQQGNGKWKTHHSGGGIPLFQCFFQQLHSHSIMQIVQRLFMPQPFSNTMNLTPAVTTDDDDEEEEDTTTAQGNNHNSNNYNSSNRLMGISKETYSEKVIEKDQDTEQVEEDEDNNIGDIILESDINAGWVHCKWMDSDLLVDLLLDRLFGLSKEETPIMKEEYAVVEASLHTCDILINIIQHSTLNAEILKKLTRDPYLGRIIYCACGGSPLLLSDKIYVEEICNQHDSIPTPTQFTCHDSIMTASMSVLESLVLQLGGYGVVSTPEEVYAMVEKAKESVNYSEDDSKALLANTKSMVRYLPLLLRSLSKLLIHPETESWETFTQYSDSPQPLLGLSRLRIIRLIESLVLLGQKDIDQLLYSSDCLEICLNLMWKFPWCSMLHQSVANLLVHIFEGDEDRHVLQKYLLYRCNIQRKLMEALSFDFQSRMESSTLHLDNIKAESVVVATKPAYSAITSSKIVAMETDSVTNYEIEDEIDIPVSDDDVDSAMEQDDQIADIGGSSDHAPMDPYSVKEKMVHDPFSLVSDKNNIINNSRTGTAIIHSTRMGYVGHIIIICQALMQACNHDFNDINPTEIIPESKGAPKSGQVLSSFEKERCEYVDVEGSRKRKTRPTSSSFDDSDHSSIELELLSMKEMVERHPIYSLWRLFLQTTLVEEVTVQNTTLGGADSSSPSLTNFDRALVEIEPRSSFVEGDISYANNDPIELDEHDLDIAASMMEALAIPRSELVEDNTKIDVFCYPSVSDFLENRYHKQEKEKCVSAICYEYDDPLGRGRQFESDLDRNEEAPFYLDDENDLNEEDAPVMDLYTGRFSKKTTTTDHNSDQVPNFTSDDFNNFSADWANFDNAFDDGITALSHINDATKKDDLFPNNFASIT